MRYYAPISVMELKSRIDEEINKNGGTINGLIKCVTKDLKVEFSCENVSDEEYPIGPEKLIGYKVCSNGFAYYGISAGGDWEHPVFFCVYWDGKKLRAYIPTDGNPWNTDTKQAYGNDEVADLRNARRRWPSLFKDADEIEPDDFDYDCEAIERDIMNHIVIKGGQKAKKQEKSRTLEQRIEALTFYGTGDEAYELFQATCTLSYKLYGLNMADKAEVACQWAEEMAHDSAIWVANTSFGPSETAKGYWG